MAGTAGVVLLQGCATEKKPASTAAQDRKLFEWYGFGLSGKTRIVIDLRTQVAQITIGGKPAGWTMVATGKEGFGTPAGQFTVLEKIVDKRSTLYGWIVDADGNVVVADADSRRDKVPPGGEFVHAPMPYWMRITWGGVGMHAGRIPEPGEPASHGCIRLPAPLAPMLFDAVKIGTPVVVVR